MAVPSSPASLLVSWSPPDCAMWNSRLLTQYSVHYQPLPPSQEVVGVINVDVDEDGVTSVNVTGLTSFTRYGVSVAAQNGKGSGPHSDQLTVAVVDSKSIIPM